MNRLKGTKKVKGGNGDSPASRIATLERMYALASDTAVRATIAARLGKSFGGERDIYTALGYSKALKYSDYKQRYERQDVARRIIDAPIKECWREEPEVTEAQDRETPFEIAWKAMVKDLNVYSYMRRVDRLASIGTYATLFLGVDDNQDFGVEATRATSLRYLMPYSMAAADISDYEEHADNKRYGLPLIYTVNMQSAVGARTIASKKVHWSRMIHVAEDLLENNVEGVPRLRPVWNRLQDLELVAGGSAEMFWRGAMGSLAFVVDKDATMGPQDSTDLADEIEKWRHDLQRDLKLEGMKVQQLAPGVSSPGDHIDKQLELIAAGADMPKRILLGSEAGHLAGDQDEKHWQDRMEARQKDHCEAGMLRPFIDRCIALNILPEPADPYTVKWPDLRTPSDKDQADVAAVRTKAIKDYASEPAASMLIPPEIFLRRVMAMTVEDVAQIENIMKGEGQEIGTEGEGT